MTRIVGKGNYQTFHVNKMIVNAGGIYYLICHVKYKIMIAGKI